MAKQVGTVKAQLSGRGLVDVPAYKVGKFWAVNDAWSSRTNLFYNVTHKMTGQTLVGYIGLRRAQKLVGILDVLLPSDSYAGIEAGWRTLPTEVKSALLEM